MNLTGRMKDEEVESKGRERANGDPQVFYFGVFDGHGGDKCSIFLKEQLHKYIEDAVGKLGLESSLGKREERSVSSANTSVERDEENKPDTATPVTDNSQSASQPEAEDSEQNSSSNGPAQGSPEALELDLITTWKDTVGGYFKRFRPDYFSISSGGRGEDLIPSTIHKSRLEPPANTSITSASASVDDATPSSTLNNDNSTISPPSIATILEYAFLRADLDFVTRISTAPPDPADDSPSLGRHSHHSTTTTGPFLGGSTCSTLLISTPTPTPFWTPTTPISLLSSHVGDTRILLCLTSTGLALPLTSTHHPSLPAEAARLRRYAAAFTTDSFGEERMSGLANTRAFGDRRSKRIGVTAEPEMCLLHLQPAEASFVVLVTDGVTGVLADQEVVDVVKEARTPEQGAKDVTVLAGELGSQDNATAMVVRLGGWERREEGGGGSLGTREGREWRRKEAADPRKGRM